MSDMVSKQNQRDTFIIKKIEVQKNKLGSFDELLRVLSEKLVPILTAPEPTSECDNNCKNGNASPIACSIEDNNYKLDNMAEYLQDIIDRIDL